MPKKLTKEEFIKKSNKVHNNKFDYSLVDYKNSKIKVKIICKKHGIFEQMPYLHLQLYGCPICRIAYSEKFIEKSNILHNNRYDYSKINYINNHTKVEIICNIHGVFNQTPQHHLRGFGCQKCSKSKGESIISKILSELNINFERQKTFEYCKDKNKLPFDFYLIDYNICVEFDGRHHSESINYWGGIEKLEYTINHDKMKNKYCEDNNIKLIRIKFDLKEENIVEIFKNIK